MSLHVQGQVVRAGETAAAHGALERLRARVFPEMARQLIGPGEAPLTSLPGALIRLLSFSKQKPGMMRPQPTAQHNDYLAQKLACLRVAYLCMSLLTGV